MRRVVIVVLPRAQLDVLGPAEVFATAARRSGGDAYSRFRSEAA